MARDHGDCRVGEVAVDDVEIGAADTAGLNLNEELSRAWDGDLEIDRLEFARAGLHQRHRVHSSGER